MLRKCLPFAALILIALIQTTPVPLRAWELTSEGLQPLPLTTLTTPLASPAETDFDDDGRSETLRLSEGRAAILSGHQIAWQSPETWLVTQAALTDLNRDGRLEAALLVWRPFQPWPVDAFLPHGGRISGFHDADGQSCHLILIGWRRGKYRELWAGSALSDPILSFAAADLTGDGAQELVTLEGAYADSRSAPARALKVWEWNGFGFSVVYTINGVFSQLMLVHTMDGRVAILTP